MQESNYVEPVLKKVGSDNVNGYACTKYDVYKGVEKARQHCVTKWSNIEGGDEIYDVMLEMSDFINKMTKAYSKGPFGSQVQFERSLFNQLKKLNGFPVHTIDYDNGSVEYVSSFVSSKKVSVDSAKFNPPTGYKKQTMDTR